MRDQYSDGRSATSDVLLSFLLGGLAGAAVAMLYAPYSGDETRVRLREGLGKGADRGRELGERVVGKSRELLDDASQYVEDGRERLSAAIDAGKEAYRREKTTMTPTPPSPYAGRQGTL